ncbi:Aminoacyl-tRNA synthetase [Macleaya cordata]|uniref:threonine--tRNA ligase n=1 Tax=Macleaya cordata TaxID=56857 RepID=A0A200PPI7_MACCD|nr:Aminoacyl-tRNA synthetase [Macleaya cordata]
MLNLSLNESLSITLLDHGTLKEGKKWISTPLDIAKEISESLASNALISRVNGTLWDMLRPLEGDCELKFFTFNTDEGRDTFWHSSAHILGEALEREYGCKLCVGLCTTRDEVFGEICCLLLALFVTVYFILQEKQPFERIEVTRRQALEMFSENKFKVEIINELPEDKTITVYRCGPLVDLCCGPHVPNTSFVKTFAASSAYWRGKKDRESLQRVYGISYPDFKCLKVPKHTHNSLKKVNHRFKSPIYVYEQLTVAYEYPHRYKLSFLTSFLWQVITPNMYNMQIWETSGHAANNKENIHFLLLSLRFKYMNQGFGLKPMNCPGHCLMFDHRVRSYRELPLQFADFGVLHRNEASGALTGLTRVRRFQQDDAHIFCMESQIKDEVKGVLEFIKYAYDIFGFRFELELSTRPENYLGDIETWKKAEAALTEALNEFGRPWQVPFYAPCSTHWVFSSFLLQPSGSHLNLA